MSLALVVTVIAMGTGAMAAVNRKRMAQLGASAGEQAHTPEETARMESLASAVQALSPRLTVILLFVAVVMMAAARYA